VFTAYVVVTVLAAAANIYGATVDITRAEWVLANMSRLGVAHSQLLTLGALKAAGGLGLLVGLALPPIGVAAALGLVLFFVGAIVTVVRSGWYAHLPYPGMFLLLAVAALALRLAVA
jgi:DoxX-like family